MKTKEKASYLVSQMESLQSPEIRGCNFDTAKISGLICVDEILKSYNTFKFHPECYPEGFRDYWEEVKQEINKL